MPESDVDFAVMMADLENQIHRLRAYEAELYWHIQTIQDTFNAIQSEHNTTPDTHHEAA